MVIKSIAVFGTGLMGKGIMQTFAVNGYNVLAFSNSKNAHERMVEYLNNEINKGRITPELSEVIFKNIKFYIYDQIHEVANADFIVESTYEDKKRKKDLFLAIDKICSDSVIFATNTSTFSITELSSVTKNPDKFCGMHFFSPVPQMQLVEIVRGLCTVQETIDVAHCIIQSINKIGITVKDTPGFLLNRILFIIIAEAIRMVQDSVSTPEDLDTALILGMNLKVGPLKLADFIGLDIVMASLDNMYEELKDSKYRPIPLLKNMVSADILGKKSGRGFYKY